MDIGRGDFVECIAALEHPLAPKASLTLGRIYRVSWVGTGVNLEGKPGVAIKVVGDGLPVGCAWKAAQFRRLYRPKSEIIRNLLQPAPREHEPA
jgi:hypothetical protein